jgi:hypothetical protein
MLRLVFVRVLFFSWVGNGACRPTDVLLFDRFDRTWTYGRAAGFWIGFSTTILELSTSPGAFLCRFTPMCPCLHSFQGFVLRCRPGDALAHLKRLPRLAAINKPLLLEVCAHTGSHRIQSKKACSNPPTFTRWGHWFHQNSGEHHGADCFWCISPGINALLCYWPHALPIGNTCHCRTATQSTIQESLYIVSPF